MAQTQTVSDHLVSVLPDWGDDTVLGLSASIRLRDRLGHSDEAAKPRKEEEEVGSK